MSIDLDEKTNLVKIKNFWDSHIQIIDGKNSDDDIYKIDLMGGNFNEKTRYFFYPHKIS